MAEIQFDPTTHPHRRGQHFLILLFGHELTALRRQ